MERLRRGLALGVLVALAAGLVSTAAADEAGPLWQPDYNTALREAEKLDRPLLLHFHATWCNPCRMMEREVLSSPGFRQQIETGFVAVKIDSDQRPDLVRQYGVRGLPSDVVIDHGGRVLTKSEGYQPTSSYLDKLASVEARYAREKAVRIAAAGGAEPPAAEPETGPSPAPVRIGLDGYSPVMLSKSRKWVRGKPAYASVYKGMTYYMTSPAELAEFEKDPQRYAPKLLECDPVILTQKDLAVAGSTQYGAFFDDELYLFVSEETRALFKKAPIRYTRTRHVINIREILDGERRTAALEELQRTLR